MSYALTENIRVYARSDWGARAPRETTPQPRAPREAFLHHSASPGGQRTLIKQKQTMRGFQDLHMGPSRGWSDIAYHFVVFQPFGGVRYARIFEGRDWRAIPAAQDGRNSGTLAICVVGNFEGEELKRNTRYAIAQLLVKHPAARAVRTVGGHRDVVRTTCPGRNVMRWIPRIADAADLKVYRG